jgi:hypothetical protein
MFPKMFGGLNGIFLRRGPSEGSGILWGQCIFLKFGEHCNLGASLRGSSIIFPNLF